LSHFSFIIDFYFILGFFFESVCGKTHKKTTGTWSPKKFQATPEQTATGKGISNPLMGVAFPKSQVITVIT
jgi:hypothetical protein